MDVHQRVLHEVKHCCNHTSQRAHVDAGQDKEEEEEEKNEDEDCLPNEEDEEEATRRHS